MVDGLDFAWITDEAKVLLEAKFDKEEVVQVVKDLQGDKKPQVPTALPWPFFKSVGQ
jgi:hypothetical protein